MEMFTVSSSRKNEYIDITDKLQEIVSKSGVKDGICVVHIPHTSAAITINENTESGVEEDFFTALNELVPAGRWVHDRTDGNGEAHIKSAIVGANMSLIVKDGNIVLGTWQDVFFVEFDGPRNGRKVLVEVK